MADIVDRTTRSRMMSRIRGRDTKPELVLRSALHRRGFRYRVHVRDLPGCPDLVLRKYRAVIFVHGCFWHRHQGCKFATTPSSNTEFWSKKLGDTVERDERNCAKLSDSGWRVAIVWECETDDICRVMAPLTKWLTSGKAALELPASHRRR